jgi:hypothetical protein
LSNSPPDCSNAKATKDIIWPPDHTMITTGIHVADPDGDVVMIKILGITQNEPCQMLSFLKTVFGSFYQGKK